MDVADPLLTPPTPEVDPRRKPSAASSLASALDDDDPNALAKSDEEADGLLLAPGDGSSPPSRSRSLSLPVTLTKALIEPDRDDRLKMLRVLLPGGSFCLPLSAVAAEEGEAALPLVFGLRSG